jgi:hypothetical protein
MSLVGRGESDSGPHSGCVEHFRIHCWIFSNVKPEATSVWSGHDVTTSETALSSVVHALKCEQTLFTHTLYRLFPSGVYFSCNRPMLISTSIVLLSPLNSGGIEYSLSSSRRSIKEHQPQLFKADSLVCSLSTL